MARGSLFEAQTQIEIASSLQFMNPAQTQELQAIANEIERLLNSIITKLSR